MMLKLTKLGELRLKAMEGLIGSDSEWVLWLIAQEGGSIESADVVAGLMKKDLGGEDPIEEFFDPATFAVGDLLSRAFITGAENEGCFVGLTDFALAKG